MKKSTKLLSLVLSVMFVLVCFGCNAPAAFDGKNDPMQAGTESEAPVSGETTAKSDKMEAYLFLHFVGKEGDPNDEQVYFSVSKDGTDWHTLNDQEPVLKSTVGEGGIRDPHIIRSPDGNKFYLIATDLWINSGPNNWSTCQTQGSKDIIIWESEDLVNWSAPRARTIARENAGCTWAPESFYDKEREAYMVFWASKTKDDNYDKHRVYRCYTTDFDTFTEPEVYIEHDVSVIDTTFIEADGVYYRFTKDEDKKFIFMEKSDSLSGEFTLVGTYTINGMQAKDYRYASGLTSDLALEGPTAFKMNGEDKWCLLLDSYGLGGYLPFVTDDISTGKFVSGADFNFNGVEFRHGSVLPITMAEYNALVEKYPFDGPVETGDLVASFDFDNETLEGTGTLTSSIDNPTYGDGVNGGRAIRLQGNYLSLDTAGIVGHDSLTVSVAIKHVGTALGNDGSWVFFCAANNNAQGWQSEKYIGLMDKNGSAVRGERYNSNNQARPPAVEADWTNDEWIHVTLVYRTNKMILFVNGQRVASARSTVVLSTLLGDNPVAYFGISKWKKNGADEDANIWLDGVRVYNYALSDAEALGVYRTTMGVQA